MKDTYKGTSTYDYAGRRKLEGAVPGNGLYTGMSFDYNHLNERTFRTGSNLDRQYAYDESSHLIGEYTGNGALIVEYIWLGDRPIAAVYSGNRIVYLVTDHQNKPRRGIDAATQQTVCSWDPDAFGVLQPATGLTNGVEMNLRFPGQYYDIQSGLYYNHNRYYNPELGRYMEPDPIGLEGGLNPYAYAGNNPVNNVDPSGLDYNFNFNGMNLGASLPSIPDPIYQGAMGFANGAALGFGQPISNWALGYQTANVNSSWYTAGELTSAFAGGGGAGKAAVQTAIRNVDNFINSFRVSLPEFTPAISTKAFDASKLKHIFREAEGHVNPVSIGTQDRYLRLFEGVASNSNNVNPLIVKSTQALNAGTTGYSQTMRNGKQVWATTRNDKITNGGINAGGQIR